MRQTTTNEAGNPAVGTTANARSVISFSESNESRNPRHQTSGGFTFRIGRKVREGRHELGENVPRDEQRRSGSCSSFRLKRFFVSVYIEQLLQFSKRNSIHPYFASLAIGTAQIP
jgi:hypothetical protein